MHEAILYQKRQAPSESSVIHSLLGSRESGEANNSECDAGTFPLRYFQRAFAERATRQPAQATS